MFRLFKPSPYQKTPLFPKTPHDPGDNDIKDVKEQDIDKRPAKKTEYVGVILVKVPILFRSLKRDDFYYLPKAFVSSITGFLPQLNPPQISQIFPGFGYQGRPYYFPNNAVIGYNGNIIMFSLLKDDDESYMTPILLNKEINDPSTTSRTLSVLLPIEFSSLAKNHQLVKIGSGQDWKDSTIELKLEDDSDTYNKLVKTVLYEIDIEYLSFDSKLQYMYIRIPGFRKEMLKIPLKYKFREDK